MRIGIFSDYFFPEIGGIQDSIASLMRELGERGNEVHAFVPFASDHDFAVIKTKRHEINLGNNVFIHRLPSFHVPSSTHQSRMVIPTFLRWRDIAPLKLDVIHSQSPFGIGIEGISVARHMKIPLIGTNHNAMDALAAQSAIKAKWFQHLAMWFSGWYYNKCNFVTAPSQSVFASMIPYGLRPLHEVVSNPIDFSEFKPQAKIDKKALKQKFSISEHSVVFAGRVGSEKKIDVVIRAIAIVKKEFPDVTFAIAGHGRDHAPALERLATELGIRDRVRFLGTLSKPDLADLYRASEVFAIASTSETQSMVTLQAMGTGIPVVAVNSRALPEYVVEGTGFIVPPDNPEAFAERLLFLLRHPVKRRTMGSKAHKMVQRFSINSITSAWERIYTEQIEKYDKA